MAGETQRWHKAWFSKQWLDELKFYMLIVGVFFGVDTLAFP